ncbi:hypothetical protein DIPPA_62765 [Diplonema papillatum]|nr:hypothetical protein DIPPA_62765 [Diplonema papillatum]
MHDEDVNDSDIDTSEHTGSKWKVAVWLTFFLFVGGFVTSGSILVASVVRVSKGCSEVTCEPPINVTLLESTNDTCVGLPSDVNVQGGIATVSVQVDGRPLLVWDDVRCTSLEDDVFTAHRPQSGHSVQGCSTTMTGAWPLMTLASYNTQGNNAVAMLQARASVERGWNSEYPSPFTCWSCSAQSLLDDGTRADTTSCQDPVVVLNKKTSLITVRLAVGVTLLAASALLLTVVVCNASTFTTKTSTALKRWILRHISPKTRATVYSDNKRPVDDIEAIPPRPPTAAIIANTKVPRLPLVCVTTESTNHKTPSGVGTINKNCLTPSPRDTRDVSFQQSQTFVKTPSPTSKQTVVDNIADSAKGSPKERTQGKVKRSVVLIADEGNGRKDVVAPSPSSRTSNSMSPKDPVAKGSLKKWQARRSHKSTSEVASGVATSRSEGSVKTAASSFTCNLSAQSSAPPSNRTHSASTRSSHSRTSSGVKR